MLLQVWCWGGAWPRSRGFWQWLKKPRYACSWVLVVVINTRSGRSHVKTKTSRWRKPSQFKPLLAGWINWLSWGNCDKFSCFSWCGVLFITLPGLGGDPGSHTQYQLHRDQLRGGLASLNTSSSPSPSSPPPPSPPPSHLPSGAHLVPGERPAGGDNPIPLLFPLVTWQRYIFLLKISLLLIPQPLSGGGQIGWNKAAGESGGSGYQG